ncbi:MAG: DUF4266 domain-containing protein [Psychromonas sp.]|nr:DUF4266 domain-containing protein [Alteromonadales bacterium]MCP5078457.1 DUF4266 domain-containing protein [Psychromonas sp.]
MSSCRFVRCGLVSIVALFLGACSSVDVMSWEKGLFAEDTMKPGGPEPLIVKANEHVFTSKEATRGGGGIGGGGCGCN